MRRSVRDAIVGFTVVGAVVAFASTSMWLHGARLGSNVWALKAKFQNAGGLAERSPVTYRGIVVGSVRSIRVTPEAVVANLDINKADLRLPQPVTAMVTASSLLGGNAQVALLSRGSPLPDDAPLPKSKDCQSSLQLCDGSILRGEEAPTLSSITETLQQLLTEAQNARIVPNLAQSTKQFELTAKEIEAVVKQLKLEIARAQPMVTNLNTATANAAAASAHVNNIVASLDNPATLQELRQTTANAAQISAKIDAVGGDVAKLTADPDFMRALRNVTIGLGELFGEVYPAQTGSSRR